jgi:hypothetical protein
MDPDPYVIFLVVETEPEKLSRSGSVYRTFLLINLEPLLTSGDSAVHYCTGCPF